MRWFLVLLVAVSAVPAAAANAPNIDGTYDVTLTSKPGFDAPTCPSYNNVQSVLVEKGQIKLTSTQPVLSGTIDDKGELDGHMRKADGTDVSFHGFLQSFEYDPIHTHFGATIIDAKANCGWSLSLVHE
jgi:hypothetical protein